MKHRKIIASKNMPYRLPLISTLVWWLVMERLSAPGWLYGVLGTLLAIAWIVAIVDLATNEEVDVINRPKE